MDILQMLSDLRAESAQVEEAILVLERLVSGQRNRRGRPPNWMRQGASGPLLVGPKRKRFSPETIAKMKASQKKRWAAKRKQEA